MDNISQGKWSDDTFPGTVSSTSCMATASFCSFMRLIWQSVLPGLLIHQDMAGGTAASNFIQSWELDTP
jgi:hypothetical protein